MNSWSVSLLKRRQLELLIGDVVIFGISFLAASLVRFAQVDLTISEFLGKSSLWLVAPIMLLLYMGVFHTLNLYSLEEKQSSIGDTVFVFIGVTLVQLTMAAVMFVIGDYLIGRTILIVHAIPMLVGVSAWHWYFFFHMLPVQQSRRLFVVGSYASVHRLYEDLEALPVCEYEVVRVWHDFESEEKDWIESNEVGVRTQNHTDLREAMREVQADVLVCSIDRDTRETLMYEALGLRQEGIEVHDLPSFYSRYCGRVPVATVDITWMLQTMRNTEEGTVSERVRRIIDLIISGFLLLIASPLMLAISIAIKVDTRGPVFFTQERLGAHEIPFKVYKFRTMVPDAEKHTGPTWADEEDPRITRVGKLLRKTRLDEMPQFFNVLRGEMAMVGIRPIRQYFADMLEEEIPFYKLRFSIKPGLTGWPQVNHDYAGSVDGQIRKFEYELYYLANRSVFLDLYIMLKTVQVMLFGRGL